MSRRVAGQTWRVAMAVAVLAGMVSCREESTQPSGPTDVTPPEASDSHGGSGGVEVFATGLSFPRGLRFGPDHRLYVAEAGAGGTSSTGDACDQVIPPVGPYTNGPSARVSRIDWRGQRTTVVDNLPSGINALGDVIGAADVEFHRGRLYVLSAGGGCSHGADVPAGILRVGRNGSPSLVADLSAYLLSHSVAQPEEDDFEPDGTFYSMIRVGDALAVVEPNHGELDLVNPRTGAVRRIADISASQGHIVPTAMAFRRHHFYVGNLNTFPIVPGSSVILRISLSGEVEVWATGFTTVLGLDFDRRGRLYVLESSAAPGFPTPNAGRIIRIDRHGGRQVVADNLFFPTGLTVGPDWRLYVSNKGYGPPQPGEILRITVPGGDVWHAGEDVEDD